MVIGNGKIGVAKEGSTLIPISYFAGNKAYPFKREWMGSIQIVVDLREKGRW